MRQLAKNTAGSKTSKLEVSKVKPSFKHKNFKTSKNSSSYVNSQFLNTDKLSNSNFTLNMHNQQKGLTTSLISNNTINSNGFKQSLKHSLIKKTKLINLKKQIYLQDLFDDNYLRETQKEIDNYLSKTPNTNSTVVSADRIIGNNKNI